MCLPERVALVKFLQAWILAYDVSLVLQFFVNLGCPVFVEPLMSSRWTEP